MGLSIPTLRNMGRRLCKTSKGILQADRTIDCSTLPRSTGCQIYFIPKEGWVVIPWVYSQANVLSKRDNYLSKDKLSMLTKVN
jgi:hypothetical protein